MYLITLDRCLKIILDYKFNKIKIETKLFYSKISYKLIKQNL
jgi:hypothetical protein